MNTVFFGPAGSTDNLKSLGAKTTVQIPAALKKMGLNAFEYQCGHGVSISAEASAAFGEACKENGIRPSLHAPYFISLSSVSEETRLKSLDHIIKSAAAVKNMGGNRIVVHSGSCGQISREEALVLASDTLKKAVVKMEEQCLDDISVCPEVMGKINQLGTLDEVLTLCKIKDNFIPCIDFGHLNARTLGGLKNLSDFSEVLDKVENELGNERMKSIHIHFSKIEYTDGGEKRHLTFEDTVFGPDFTFLAEEIVRRDMSPVIICESAGTQDIDAVSMKKVVESLY